MENIIIYNTKDGKAAIKLYADNGTVWLNQAQIAVLFDKERSGITKHIKNIFSENELDEKSNVNFLHIANSDKPVAFYSLDVILAVGFSVTVGLIFGILPARKASKLNPIDALRAQ